MTPPKPPLALRHLVDPSALPSATEIEWLDRLPVGTVLSATALARFRWPVDPYDPHHWLVVGCSSDLDDEAYRTWLTQLPDEGVLLDPSDHRVRRLAGS